MLNNFGTNIKINAALLSSAYPQIAEQFGPDQELDLEIKWMNPRIRFGSAHGENVAYNDEIHFGIMKHGDRNYLLFDELKLESFMNFRIEKEVLHAEMTHLKLSREGDQTRKQPKYNNLNISE